MAVPVNCNIVSIGPHPPTDDGPSTLPAHWHSVHRALARAFNSLPWLVYQIILYCPREPVNTSQSAAYFWPSTTAAAVTQLLLVVVSATLLALYSGPVSMDRDFVWNKKVINAVLLRTSEAKPNRSGSIIIRNGRRSQTTTTGRQSKRVRIFIRWPLGAEGRQVNWPTPMRAFTIRRRRWMKRMATSWTNFFIHSARGHFLDLRLKFPHTTYWWGEPRKDGVIKEGPKKLLPHLQRIYYSPQHKVSDFPWPPVALLAYLYTLYEAGIPSLHSCLLNHHQTPVPFKQGQRDVILHSGLY